MSEIFLLRHCDKTEEHHASPLSPLGFRQAEQLVPILADLDIEQVITSPFLRARQSAQSFVEKFDIPVTENTDFAEWQLSGEPTKNWKEHLTQALLDHDFSAEGGETANHLWSRASRGLDVAREAGRRTLIVAHGGLLTVLLGRFGRPALIDDLFAIQSPDLFAISNDGWRHIQLPDMS